MDPLPPALSTYIAVLKAHDVEMIGASLADEVQFITPAKTMDKPIIIECLAALYRGFPDWNYDHDKPALLEDGSCAVFWGQGGIHPGSLAFPGFDAVEATGKSVSIPSHHFFYRVGEAGLTEIRPDPHSQRSAQWYF